MHTISYLTLTVNGLRTDISNCTIVRNVQQRFGISHIPLNWAVGQNSRYCDTMMTAVFPLVYRLEQLILNDRPRNGAATGKPNIADASHEPPLDVKRRDG
jgi:hypothetical protein